MSDFSQLTHVVTGAASSWQRGALPEARPSILSVLVALARYPVRMLLRRWNWKSAVLSPMFRGGLFFFTNLSAGVHAASAALVTEFAFRAVFSGFYGAVTEAFRSAEPRWAAVLSVMLLLPVANHSVEFLVHWLRETPALWTSIAVSATFTSLSTAFNLFAMRRGVLIVGEGHQSLFRDLARMPALVMSFVWSISATPWRLLSKSGASCSIKAQDGFPKDK